MSTIPRRLSVLDLETTGFTDLHRRMVYQHRILEIGAVVTDEQFNVLARHSVVIHHNLDEVLGLCDQKVLDMHTQSGLFDAVAQSTTSLEAAEREIITFLADNGVQQRGSPLCGNGVHFDRNFIEAHLPDLSDFLCYRNLDISSIKEFLKLFSTIHEPKKSRSHRALEDILESVEEAQAYRDLLAPLLEA